MNVKKRFYVIFLVLVMVLILAINWVSFLRMLGAFLVIKDDLRPADAIVVLGGDNERVVQAVDLYQEGFAHFIIISGADPFFIIEEMKKLAVKGGVPAERILLEPKARHTFQHPLFVKPILLDHGFTSVIVVSSPYHMRRAAMLFNGEFRGTGIKLLYYPAQHSWFDAKHWWQSAEGRRVVFSEYAKMSVNSLGCDFDEFLLSIFPGLHWHN